MVITGYKRWNCPQEQKNSVCKKDLRGWQVSEKPSNSTTACKTNTGDNQ